MTWLTENPLPPVVIGIVIEAILVVALAKTGKRGFLWGMLATAGLVVAAVVIERTTVTPREQVIAAIEEMRSALERNDRAALLDRIDPSAKALRNRVQIDLAQVTIAEAKLTDEHVEVDPSGTVSKTDVTGVVRIEGGPATLVRKNFPIRFELELRKRPEDGRWMLFIAEYRDLTGGL